MFELAPSRREPSDFTFGSFAHRYLIIKLFKVTLPRLKSERDKLGTRNKCPQDVDSTPAWQARSVKTFGNSKLSQLECKNSARPDVCYSTFYSVSKTIRLKRLRLSL
jgi:hypothetical protein